MPLSRDMPLSCDRWWTIYSATSTNGARSLSVPRSIFFLILTLLRTRTALCSLWNLFFIKQKSKIYSYDCLARSVHWTHVRHTACVALSFSNSRNQTLARFLPRSSSSKILRKSCIVGRCVRNSVCSTPGTVNVVTGLCCTACNIIKNVKKKIGTQALKMSSRNSAVPPVILIKKIKIKKIWTSWRASAVPPLI